ncbi:hypothetical protein Tco_1385356 [Tanacetum coccineum]
MFECLAVVVCLLSICFHRKTFVDDRGEGSPWLTYVINKQLNDRFQFFSVTNFFDECDNFFMRRDLEAAFEYPGEFHSPSSLMIYWGGNDAKWGSPAGIRGLFSGWYCGLASRKVTLGVSMAWAKEGVTDWRYYKPGTRAWVIRGSRKIRIPVDMYPCRVEERLTIKLVKGKEVLKIETTVTAKDGTITKFPRKFPEYKPTKGEEEILKLRSVWEKVNYDISDSDSDLESTTKSGPRDGEIEDTDGSGIRIDA